MTLTHEQTVRLCELVRVGDQSAADKLVRGHMGIVWTVLKRLGHHGDDELIQAGRIGLWAAAQSFDPERARWSTFAMMVVRQHINREVRRRETEAGALPPANCLAGGEGRGEPACLPEQLLSALPDDHRRLLVTMYSGRKRRTLDQAARDLGIGKARARRLHRNALQMLREAGSCER